MSKFIGRKRELGELNRILSQPGAQFILVYGRRRVGKTTLLLNWAEKTGKPYIYWVANRDTPAQVRLGFTRAVWRWAHPESQAVPRFDTWEDAFETTAQLVGDQPVILILDEFSYATESDPSLASHLQAAWDHLFKDSNVTIVLSGSHIGMMVDLMGYQAPLYGRFTAQLPVDPLPFADLSDFLPRYTAAERVAVFAVTGGVPAYLERFDDRRSLTENLRDLFMQRTSIFRTEPFFLIGDVIRRETQTYEAVLKSIAAGNRTPQDIGNTLGVSSSYLSPYLKQLEELHLVRRRIPATTPPERREKTKTSQYHLTDSYLRFYFRFIAPNADLVEQELSQVLWDRISDQFRAFVGMTAFEDLCREWVLIKARTGKLPMVPEVVGSHWSADTQVDVVAVNWHDKAILLGECKWGVGAVGRSVVRELVDKAPKVVPSEGWQVHNIYFARAGFTDAARTEASTVDALLVDLEILDRDLRGS
ncbi:MAG: ATP-binding protein [bacterium]|nr:ATP-binding protein [bacterium]